MPRCAAVAALGLGLSAVAQVGAAPIVIDDFGQPNPEQFYVIGAINADPLLHKTSHASILGGERDLLVDVVGTAELTSATGTIGGGVFDFGSQDAVLASLQWDGVDADQLLPTRALVNAQGLTVDLTGGGMNGQLVLSFTNLDAGEESDTLPVSITLTGPAGATASFSGTIPEGIAPFDYVIPFASMSTAGGFSFGNVTSIGLTLNGGTTRPDADFGLDSFTAAPIPEPAALSLLGVAAFAA